MNLQAFLPPGVALETLIVAMAGISAALTLVAVWSALMHKDPAARRARLMAGQRDLLRAGLISPQRRQRVQSLNFMRQVVERLQLMSNQQGEKITLKLTRAGMRSKDALVRYLFYKLALPFVFGGIAVLVFYGIEAYELAPPKKLALAVAAVLLGAYGPDLYLRNLAGKRQDKIRKALPDALDLMVICAEAGLSLDATLTRVADEMAQANPELADEFALTALELGFLQDRQQALRNLGERCNLKGVRGVVNTLIQAERYGTPLAQSLRVMSAEFRDERMLKAEEKAARLPALLTVPMIVFILPPLFVVLIGPAALDIIDALRSL